MAVPSITGYEQIITGGAFVDAVANHSGFLNQCYELFNFHRNVCSRDRTFASGTFYVSSSRGNDNAALFGYPIGSSGSPFRTLAAVSGAIAPLGGHYRVRLARGDKWIDPTGLNIDNHYNVCMDDYGNPADRIPLVTAFKSVNAFTNKQGTAVSGVEQIALASTDFANGKIEWVQEGDDYAPEFFQPYIEYATSGELHQAPAGGYYWASGFNQLYVKPYSALTSASVIRATNSPLVGVGVNSSIDVSGDTRLGVGTMCNIRADGFGMNRISSSVYGISFGGQNSQVWASGLQQFYSWYHNIGYLGTGGANTMRTRVLMEACNAGYCKPQGNSPTSTAYVQYSVLGNSEFLYYRNNCLGGGIKSKELIATTGSFGSSFYGHTAGPPAIHALCIALENRNYASGNRPAVVPTMFGDVPNLSGRHNVTGYRVYVIADDNDPKMVNANFPSNNNTVYMRSQWNHDLRGQVVFTNAALIASGLYGGTIFEANKMNIDITLSSFSGGFSSMFSRTGFDGDANYDYSVTFDSNNIFVKRQTNQGFLLGDIASTGNVAFHGNKLIFTNNIITTNTSGTFLYPNVVNRVPTYINGSVTGGMFRNVAFGLETADLGAGFGLAGFILGAPTQNAILADAQTVVTGIRPAVGNPAFRTASGYNAAIITPSVDYNNLPRTGLFSIGALEDAPVPVAPVIVSGFVLPNHQSDQIIWRDPNLFTGSGYIVEKALIPAVATSGGSPTTSGNNYIDTSFRLGNNYSYRVSAFNENSEASPYSDYFYIYSTFGNGVQAITTGVFNNTSVYKQSVIKSTVVARNVPNSDIFVDNSKLGDRIENVASRNIYGSGTVTVSTPTYTRVAASGDLGKKANRGTWRMGYKNVEKTSDIKD